MPMRGTYIYKGVETRYRDYAALTGFGVQFTMKIKREDIDLGMYG